jgi:uncharacterized repeat protein (TIGR01451 family)
MKRAARPARRSLWRPRSLFVAAVTALAAVAVLAPAASAHAGAATITCTQVTFEYTKFIDSGRHSVAEEVWIDNKRVAGKTFEFSGESATDVIPISVPSGQHRVHAKAFWTSEGKDKRLVVIADLDCTPPAPPPPGPVTPPSQPASPSSQPPPATRAPAAAPTADVAVAKSADRAEYVVGERVVYGIVVTNNGPSAATNVALTDYLPPALVPLSATPQQGTCAPARPAGPADNVPAGAPTPPNLLVCSLGSMAAGASVNVAVETLAAIPGQAANLACVTRAEADANPANDCDDAVVSVTAPRQLAAVPPTKQAAPKKAAAPKKVAKAAKPKAKRVQKAKAAPKAKRVQKAKAAPKKKGSVKGVRQERKPAPRLRELPFTP